MKYRFIIIIFFLNILFLHVGFAQKPTEKYKLAQSFEKGGDLKNAERIYRELYDANPSNEDYFNAVIRCNKQLNQFQEIIPVVEKQIRLVPSSMNIALLAELNWRTGKTKEANDLWQKALESNESDEKTYEDVAMSQVNLRLWPKAIATYQLGRTKLNNNQVFSNQLSQLYSITGDYKNGIAEVMNLYSITHNIQYVQGRIAAMNQTKEAELYIYQILEKNADGGQIENLRLFAWYLTTIGKYEEAFQKTKVIDGALHMRGNEVFNFATTMQRDGKYNIAIKAYEYLIDMGRESQFTVNALYGLTRSLELSQSDSNILKQQDAESIISRYRKIAKEYPQSTLAEDSRFRIAVIYYNLQNYTSALDELNQILNTKNYIRIIPASMNLASKIYIETDDLIKAEDNFRYVVRNYKNLNESEYINALYGLAKLNYFKGNIDSAIALFTDITVMTSSDDANDALEKISNIEQFKKYNKGFELFLKAELKNEQKKYDDAVSMYIESANAASNSELSEKAYIAASEIEAARKHFSKAREFLQQMLLQNQESLNGDYILYHVGKYYVAEGNKADAMIKFNELLAKYPRSIYLNPAREIIQQIRPKAN